MVKEGDPRGASPRGSLQGLSIHTDISKKGGLCYDFS
jgi:hypothetical protein